MANWLTNYFFLIFVKNIGVIDNNDIKTTIIIKNSKGIYKLRKVPNGTNIKLASKLELLINSYERAEFLLFFEVLTFLSVSCDIIIPEAILFAAVINKNANKSENMIKNKKEA